MKKRFLITLLLTAFAMVATAQNKKIAILETVDKKGDVPYGILLQLRSNLTYAISNTLDYEGYDRVDMAQIIGEHDFQRTGMVSDEQIRRLGAMTGCSSILVAEAAVYDKENIIITAKILNVETASVERAVPPQVASIDPKEMQKACVELAEKLLVKTPVEVEEIQIELAVEKVLITKGKDFYGKDYYSLGEQKLTTEQYMDLLKNCPEAWYAYEKGNRRNKTAKVCLYSGISCMVVGGIVCLITSVYEQQIDKNSSIALYSGGGGLMVLGGVSSLVSIPLFISANGTKSNVYQIYNQYCAQPKATLSFGPTANGIGVCLNF